MLFGIFNKFAFPLFCWCFSLMDFFFCFNDELKIVRFHCSYVIQKRKTLFPQEEKTKLKLNHPIERFQGQTSITFFVWDEFFFFVWDESFNFLFLQQIWSRVGAHGKTRTGHWSSNLVQVKIVKLPTNIIWKDYFYYFMYSTILLPRLVIIYLNGSK